MEWTNNSLQLLLDRAPEAFSLNAMLSCEAMLLTPDQHGTPQNIGLLIWG